MLCNCCLRSVGLGLEVKFTIMEVIGMVFMLLSLCLVGLTVKMLWCC